MVNFRNLDLGYEQCRDLYNSVRADGTSLLDNLRVLYNSLNAHWKGTDATLHINQLVDIHTAINTFVAETCNAVAYAADKIVEVQEVRKSNGSAGMVGEQLGDVSEQERLSHVEETSEYYCTPEAKDDYQKLVEVCGEFDKFVTEVHDQTDELMNNWTEGNEREKVVRNSNEFENQSEEFKKHLAETRSALDIAVANMTQIM